MASSLPDYMPGIETAAEEHAPEWMRPALNAVRPEWEERRNRWEELGAAALYGDFLKAGQQGELDARIQEVMGKNKVFRDFMEERDKPLSRMYMGREVMRALYGSRFRDVPEMYFHSRGEQMPEKGRKSLNDGYAAVWDDFSGKTRKRYADYQQKKAEFQRGLEEFGRELETALPEAVLQGKILSPDMMEKATRYGQAERVTASLQRARAAVDLLRGVNRSGASQGAHEGAVQAEAERIFRDENTDGSYYRILGMEIGKPKTEEEAQQQARANMGHSYEVTREFVSHLVNVLSDEDGQLDEGALGAMMLALDADAQGQQTIDARFVRNMGEALKRWWLESDDFLKRYTKKDPFNEFLDVRNTLISGKPLTLEGYLADKQQEEETHRRLYEDPRVEKLKSALSRIEDTRLSAADKAGFLAGSLTELGTITGDSAPAVLAGLASGGLSIAAFAPASMNRSVAQAHADGRQNAELYGLITGGFDALAEGSFGVAVRRVPFVGKLMDKAALGLIGKPVVGKAAAAVQSNWFLRFLGDRVVAESFGELVGEEVISQTGSYLTIQGLRGLGVDMDAPEWKPFSTAWENIQDERQSAATVAYCAALGLMGLSADTRAAREFSRSRENLMTVGLTPETATRLAAMTEETMNQAALLQAGGDLNASKLRELDDKLQTEYRNAYQKEVVNEDPVKLRDRLKKNHDLFMSDVEAQVSLKEGVLKAALREQGVLDVEESLTGKNVVTVEDAEQAEKDRASWQDGKMPEGYEMPVKKVEWTDEQLAAYSQYAIGNEGLKRMKAIRSAALNLDMAAKVDEKDYAKTLPLTESSVPVAAELARSKGAMTIDVLRAMSEAAAKEGEAGRNVLPGVSNAAVGAMEESFVKRLQWEARSGNTSAASRMLSGEGGAAAIRLTAGEGPASRILYNPGHTLSTNLTEDVVESMLVDKLRKEGGMDGQGSLTDAGKEWLAAMHRDMQAVRRQVLAATGKDIMPGLEKAEPSLMNVAEYFSHLSQSAFYQQAGQYGLNDAAMRHVKFMDSALLQAKYLNDTGAGFAKWADTEAGRSWQKEGGTLAGLLRETGHELADLYTSSRITAENVAAVEEARRYRRANGTRTVEDIRAELETVEQEAASVTPESELEARQPQEIPAEESVTGEAIPVEANEEVPDTDPESGEFVPPPGSVIETDPEGKGRGLEGGRYAEDGVEGSVIGMVPFSSLAFSELPYAGYLAADGMAEVLRHADGRMEVIMGGALLRQEQRSMKVRVWDADATHNEAWARGRALEQMVLSGVAPKAFSVRDYLEYYRHLYPAGLPDRAALGKLGKKARQAVTIHEKAAPELVQDVLSGAVSAADAYAAVETAATPEGQRFFLDQKAADKKASLEYLTALTRAYEAAPGTDTETLQHQARYTEAARKEIRKTVSRLRDVRGEKPRAVAQRELGINLPTAEAVADAITRLDLLDASFDAFESDLDIPGRAAEWDGKSPVRVVADFMEAREEVKQMDAAQKAADSLDKDAALLEQARNIQLPEPKKWMKPRTVPLTEAQAQEVIVKALELFASKDSTRPALNMVLHEVKDGREWYVATDGRRLAAVSRIASDAAEGTRELLGKAGMPSDLAAKYPEWRQVVPRRNMPGTRTDLVDMSKFSFLEDARSGKDEFDKPTFRTRDGWRVGLANHGKITVLNPEYFAAFLKQVKKLNRELGMPTQVEVTCPATPYDPVRIDMGAGDWTFTSVLMPVRGPEDSLRPDDIILNAHGEQASTREAQPDTMGEQKAQPADEQKREEWADGFAKSLDQQRGAWHRQMVDAIMDKEVGYVASIIAQPHGQNDKSKKLFSAITGIKLPRTAKGILEELRKWSPEGYAAMEEAKARKAEEDSRQHQEKQEGEAHQEMMRYVTTTRGRWPHGYYPNYIRNESLKDWIDRMIEMNDGKLPWRDLRQEKRHQGYQLLGGTKNLTGFDPEGEIVQKVSYGSGPSFYVIADAYVFEEEGALQLEGRFKKEAMEYFRYAMEQREASRPKTEEAKEKAAPDKLEDAGRKILAHKDNYTQGYTSPLKAGLPEDAAAVTVSKYFPVPNYEKLINEGMSQDAVVALCLVRDSIPDKPRGWRARSGYMTQWMQAFQTARQLSADLLEGRIEAPEILSRLRENDMSHRVAIYTGVGYPLCLKARGFTITESVFWSRETDTREKGWGLSHESDKRGFVSSGKRHVPDSLRFKKYDTVEEVISDLRLLLSLQSKRDEETQHNGKKGKRPVKLEVGKYSRGARAGEVVIYKRLTGGVHVVLKGGFKDFQEARDYRDAHLDELAAKLKRISSEPDIFPVVSAERVGEDYRGGKDVDNAMFMETFGINGITYGNWVAGPERQAKLNATYDAFMDLANLLGVPPRVISLSGELGIQFGASGRGSAMAHYRLDDVSINLTRKLGSGSLAHEWFHALDNYFQRRAGRALEMSSDHIRSGTDAMGMNDQAAEAFIDLVRSIRNSDYKTRSGRMPGKPGYWDSTTELMARAFQVYVVKKMEAEGLVNEYLSNYSTEEAYDAKDEEYKEAISESRYPYPTAKEMEKFGPKFDAFLQSLTHARQDNGNYVTFSVTDTEDVGAPAETTFSVAALNVDGTMLTPEAFITRPDGNPDWFTIPRRRGQAAMPVRLLAGKDMGEHKGYGLTHIAASRDLDGLWVQTTPERYLSSILANASELYEVVPGREILVKGKRPASWMVLQLVKADGYYSIITAHPVEGTLKKPKGRKIPFDGRFSSTPGKEATGVFGSKDRNPSGGLPSKGGALDKASQEAMTADRGYAYSLPPGAHVVNINDVRLRFDDGRQMQAGSSVSTMSLALMDDGLDSAPHLKERVVQQLIGDVRTAVRRFNRVFAGSTSTESAARELGQAQALLGMINKYASKGYRPRLAAQMRYVEVYARMLESGKILSYGKLNAQELDSLKEDLEADLADAVDVSALGSAWETAAGMEVEGELKNERMLRDQEKKGRQEVRDTLVRDYAGRKLDEVVRDMLNQGAAQLEKQLKDEEIARIGSLLDFLRPRKDPKTGKLKKGFMNADAYRRVARITRMMEATPEEKSAQMEAINTRLAPQGEGDRAVTLEEAELDRLSLELLDWSAYGALESMSLDAVRAAGESLRELVLVERNAWESRLEDEKMRLKKVAMDAVAVLGKADSTDLRMMSEADLKARRLFGMMAENVMSFSQAMLAMGGMRGAMKELAQETLDAVSDGHIALAARERAVMDQLDEFKEEELGLTTERQKADFIEYLKKTIKTGIVREKIKVHSLDLTVEEAQRWLSMSKEERQAERDRMREEAESKGWAVENMVEEDDLLPLKDALNTALNPSPRIDGKKGRKRERVQVKREYVEKQKPLEASVDQLLNVILTYEQPFYAENARINGYTPEVLDVLRRKVGADALAYGYKMRDLLSESGVDEEFEWREGVPFPAQVNYWMSRFWDSSRINQNLDALDVERGTGTRYGMLIQRVDHKDEVDLSLGATNVFKAACAQQNNYLVMGRMTAKWRRLLANKEFSASLNQKLGNNRFVAIKQMIDLFDGAGVMEAVTQRAASSLTNMSQSAHAVSVLSFALTTIAKQPSALMHAAAFKNPVKVAKQIILDRMGQGKITFSEMLKSPAFQARYRDNRVWVEMMNMKSDVKWTRMAVLSRMGMDAIEKVDIWSNCVSMTALYNITWKELEANNKDAAEPMTEEQMKEICERAVKNALELVGQPQRLTQRSMMAALGKNNIWVKTSCYMGSEMLNKTGMTVAIGEMSRAQGESAVKRFGRRMLWLSTMSGMEQVILMLLDLMRGNGPDDEEEWMEWLVYNAVTGLSGVGLLNNLPVLGAPLEYFSGKLNKLLTGKNTSFVKTGLLSDMLFNVRGWSRCFDKLTNAGKLSDEERVLAIADTIRLGAAGSGITRGAYSTMQWTSTLSGILQSCSAVGNMVRPFLQRAINEEKQEKRERKERARRW